MTKQNCVNKEKQGSSQIDAAINGEFHIFVVKKSNEQRKIQR
jgi:hypothetical protein